MRSLKPWQVKKVKLGGVYHPLGNPDFIYVVVRLTDEHMHFLMLLSNSRMSDVQVGCVLVTLREGFNDDLRAGRILRCA